MCARLLRHFRRTDKLFINTFTSIKKELYYSIPIHNQIHDLEQLAHALTPQPSTETLQSFLLFNPLLCLSDDVGSELSLHVQFRILGREWGIAVFTELHWNAVGDVGV